MVMLQSHQIVNTPELFSIRISIVLQGEKNGETVLEDFRGEGIKAQHFK